MATRTIDRVGVLGAGIMGTGIACHLANAGVEVLLLDIPPPDGKGGKNAFAERGLQAALKASPKPLFHPSRIRLITPGNFDDDLEKLRDCQWVVEAVKEDLDVKRKLFERVEKVIGPDTIVSSNTSGIPLGLMVEGRSPSFAQHFLITHFFNPVRYMKLLEIVAGPKTDPAIVERMTRFTEDVLGKGVVVAKDTPNFIANRIGTYSMLRALKEMETQGATVEELDAIFGRPLGRPKSAIFRTADVVGLDTLLLVAKNCHDNLGHDPERELYQPPKWLAEMVQNGQLGAKSGQGFYKKGKKSESNPKGLDAWDWREKAYRPLAKVRIESLGAARNLDDLGERLRAVVFADDRAGKIAWPVVRDSLVYSMRMLGEIADDVQSIDAALRWGFAWDVGPFETWDLLGFEKVAARMEAEGVKLSPWIQELRKSGAGGIYAGLARTGKAPKRDPKRVDLKTLKAEGAKVVKSNSGASLIDVGDGIFALEFHTKANAIDNDVGEMIVQGAEWVEENGRGMVIYNEGEHFSVGANLMLIYMLAQAQDFKGLEGAVNGLQQALQRVRYAKVPVIAAPSGMALGGGCEVCLATGYAAGVRPAAEVYMGLVEVGVGLIPAGGGVMNTVLGMMDAVPPNVEIDPLMIAGQAFKQIATAQVSMSVEEARALAYIPKTAGVTMDRRRLLHDAKQLAIGAYEAGYRPPLPRAYKLPGESGIATLKTMVRSMVQAGQATEYEGQIAVKLANVVCGGIAGHTRPVTEQQMLDLEREAFLSLAGEAKTQERMAFMLTNNKPLRN